MRAMVPSTSRFGLVLCVYGALAARIGDDVESALDLGLAGGADMGAEIICGGDKIWNMLTASDSVTSIQNVKWGRILAIAHDYIEETITKEKKLEVAQAQLTVRIALKKKMEAPAHATEDQIRTLITNSITSSFGSVQVAADSQCGRPSFRPRPPAGAYRKAKQAFGTGADTLFTESVRLQQDEFLPVCHSILPPNVQDTWCASLCQEFMNAASTLSSQRAGEQGGVLSDDLIKELMAKKMKLQLVKADIARCQKAKDFFTSFKTQVETLKKAQHDRFEELQIAEEALDDALYDLEGLEMDMHDEQVALEEADAALKGDTANLADIQKKIMDTNKIKAGLLAKMVANKALLTQLRTDLMQAEDATGNVLILKGAVSKVMLQMRSFFSEAVLQPLKFMGLDEECDVDDYFVKDSNPAGKAAEFLVEAVDKLSDYCETTGKEAFEAVKDQVDLSDLCKIGDPAAFKKEAMDAVKKKEDLVKKGVQGVLDWMDVYNYNKGMTKEIAAQRVADGETPGFQEIVGVYSRTDFFRSYLKNWRLGGPMLKLITGLKTMSDKLTQDVNNVAAAIEDFANQLEDANAKLKKLAGELKAAQEKQVKSAQAKAKVANAVAVLEQKSAAITNNLDALKEAVRIAKENCKKADDALLAAMQEAKAHVKGGELLELRELEIESQQNVRKAKRAVATAERHLLNMEKWAFKPRKLEA